MTHLHASKPKVKIAPEYVEVALLCAFLDKRRYDTTTLTKSRMTGEVGVSENQLRLKLHAVNSSQCHNVALLAQSVERWTFNPTVKGSSPL